MTCTIHYSPEAIKAARQANTDIGFRREFLELANNPDKLPEIEVDPIPSSSVRKTTWTVDELYTTPFPEPTWIIPGIWPVGLTFLGGRPKVGKSWLLLQAAYSVSMGGRMFEQKIQKGDVLYLAYEDSPRRLKGRCQLMKIHQNASITFKLYWKPLHQGGVEDLLIEIEGHDYKFIIIDTLTRAIPGVDQNDQRIIGPIIADLQRMALGHNISLTLADHTRKPNGLFLDPIDDIMGSTAKSAAADAVLALYKEQGKTGAQLRGRGKDIEEVDLALTFDKETGCWQSKGNASEIAITEARNEIIGHLKSAGKSKEASITKALKGDRGNIYKRLQDMVNAGIIRKEKIEGNVYYDLVQQ